MGQRSATEAVVAVILAFLEERTWIQAELARRVGVGVPRLRKVLDQLSSEGGDGAAQRV